VLLKKRTYFLTDVIGESCLVRVFVTMAHANTIIMGRSTFPPIMRKPSDAVLPDGEEEFSDDEGEEWKDR
jgi:hypothetical protein